MNYVTTHEHRNGVETNKLAPQDRAVHDWYRFVLSFPPHLVQEYLTRFDVQPHQHVLDPFCGTGTVLVECKKRGIASIGIEANPFAHFASTVKVHWKVNANGLQEHASQVAELALKKLASEGIEDEPFFHIVHTIPSSLRVLSEESTALLLANSISPLPLHKTLVLLDCMNQLRTEEYYQHELLALAKALVFSISNLHFGPEVGVGPHKHDSPVVSVWLQNIRTMVHDLHSVQQQKNSASFVHHADARQVSRIIERLSIDAVITSPPYPNEKDYTRTTRLESVVLGFLQNKDDLQALKHTLLRSNTRNVYKGDSDDQWVATHLGIQNIARAIEAKRIELGKTSGFERLYGRVTKLYFGGIARHLQSLLPILRPEAQLAYVVGDQASYLQVKIPTGQLIAEIAQSLGYDLVSIDLFRTRFATATRTQLREEVVVLRAPHQKSKHSMTTGFTQDTRSHNTSTTEEHCIMSNEEGPQKLNRYQHIMERIFFWHYTEGDREIVFEREDMVRAAQELQIKLPKNLGDIPYSFRYRSTLPASIRAKAPAGEDWIIRPSGRSRSRFVATVDIHVVPNTLMVETKIPDATPSIVAMYAQGDEQALLARLRYNRLLDIFTGVTCYSLQNHVRTTVPNIGQVETDELYIGIDSRGAHYVFPVQAKGGKDRLGIVQIEQDFALCADKFPSLICRSIAAQFIEDTLIALFEFEENEQGVALLREMHYRLVTPDAITGEDIQTYASRPSIP